MSRINYICVNQKEWDRLKRQAQPPESPRDAHHLQRLAETQESIQLSQTWVQTWPNSLQAHVANKKARDKDKRQRQLDLIEAGRALERSRPRVNARAMQRARQMIFNDSGYGKELLGALHWSKVREERDKQIELNKFIQQEALKHEKAENDKIAAMANNLYEFHQKDQERTDQLKKIDEERRAHNKMTSEIKKEKARKEDLEEKILEREDARLMKQLLDFEAGENKHCKAIEESAMAQFKVDDSKVREGKKQRDELDNQIIEVWRRHADTVYCKMKKVHDKMHKEKHNTPLMKNAYEHSKRAQETKEKALTEFIDKGIQRYEKELLKKEEANEIAEKNKKAKVLELAEEYKNAVKESDMLEYCRKCMCDRNSLTLDTKTKKPRDVDKYKVPQAERPSFLTTRTPLHDALRARSQQPTPWNALSSQHAHFAQQAEAVLAECTYKAMARKVVDNYRKTNCLDAKKLPIASYDDHTKNTEANLANPIRCTSTN